MKVLLFLALTGLCFAAAQNKDDDDDYKEAPISIQDGFMLLNQDNFDDALERNELTVIEFIKSSGKTSPWIEALSKSGNSLFGKPTGFGRVDCKTDSTLCDELITKELTSEDVRDVMLYLRDAMTAHVMPRTIADNADAFLAWGKEELAKVPAPSNEKDGKDFDWSALKDEATIALDDASFNAHVAKGDTLVDFYATWCPACQQLAPVWAEVAKSLPQARFAKVDVDKGVLTSTLYAVESLPTIVLLRGDRYLTYEGDRTKEAIVAFATANHPDDDKNWKKVGEPPAAEDEAGPEVPDAHSLVLDDSNFDAQLAGKTAVVDFYATWCGHCQQLAPKWAAAAAEGAPLVFAKVDVDKAEVTSGRFNIEGLPTVLKVKGDRYIEFEGERSKEAILAFARTEHKDDDSKWKKVGEAAPKDEAGPEVPDAHSLVLDDSNFDAQLAGKTAVVDFYATWCGHCQQLAPKWAAAAAEGAPLVFAKVDVDKAEVTSGRFNIEGLPTVLKVKGDRYIEFEGERSKEAILAFARTEHKDDDSKWKKVGEAAPREPEEEIPADVPDTHSLVLDESNFDTQLAGKTAVVEFYAPWCGHCKALAPKWAAAAAEGAPLVFAKVDVDKAEGLGQRFNVEGFPTILKVRNGREYIEFNGNRNKADILAFARETHDETAWKKSNGPLTEEEEKDLVTVLDEKNFDAAMSADPSVTWVVDFYAPWCAHCKKLAPEWAKAAALVARNRRANVRFGKVDVDKNDPLSERFNVKGLPTVLKLKGGASELFVGKREAAALAEWAIEPMSGPAQPEDVPISSAQFDNEFRGKGQTWLLVFTAQWCSHCRAFKPVFRSIKQKVPSGVRAYLVDADDSSDLVDTFAVTELPTILLVKDGKVTKYGGQHLLAPVLEFASGKIGPSDKAQADVAPLPPLTTPPGVEHHTSDEALVNAVATGKHLLVILGGRRHKASEKFRTASLPILAKVPEGNHLRVAVVESGLVPSANAVFNHKGIDLPLVVLVEGKKFWSLPHQTFNADEILSMAIEGMPDKEALPLAFAPGTGAAKPEQGVEEEDEFGRRPDSASAEAPLRGLEKHEQKESASKKQPPAAAVTDPLVFGDTHLKMLLERRGAHHKHRWAVLFYDTRDAEWEPIWKPIWQEVARQLEGTARAGLVSWRDESGLHLKLGIDRGFQAGVFEGGSFYLAPEIEGDGPLVIEQLVNFARGGYLASTPISGVPGSRSVLETLSDADYVKRTAGVDPWLIVYSKPGCILCGQVTLLVERVGHASGIRIATVDTERNEGVAKLERITYHPTVKIRSAGRSFVYTGDNEFNQLLAFAQTGWKEKEVKTRPQPQTKQLHPEEPPEEEGDEESAFRKASEHTGPTPTERVQSLIGFFRRNSIALIGFVIAVVVASVVGFLISSPKKRKPKTANNKANNSPAQKQRTN